MSSEKPLFFSDDVDRMIRARCGATRARVDDDARDEETRRGNEASTDRLNVSRASTHRRARMSTSRATAPGTMASTSARAPRVGGVVARRTRTTRTRVTRTTSPDARDVEELALQNGACVVARKYSPDAVRERALRGPGELAKTVLRCGEIVWNAASLASGLLMDGVDERERVSSRSEQLRVQLAELGPSFVKAGQVLANRPDIVRSDYMEELCKLQDDVPAFENDVAFGIIENELGRPIDAVFSKISSDPVAAASLGQVYRATLRETGEEVAIKVQRPGIEPIIYRDLLLFRTLAWFINGYSVRALGCNAQLIVDEFGEKLLEELDYVQEGRNLNDFYDNFRGDPIVKIPKYYKEYSGSKILTMEWIDGIRCTDPQGIIDAGIDVEDFIKVGVVSGLRQLLEFGLFHGDPHPGNIFAMRDGRIAYVDFGNVAQLTQTNKEVLIDAVVHAVNEDYDAMAGDFIRLGFLSPGTDVRPIVPALENIWQDARTASLANFNFRTVTSSFNKLVYQYPIRIPERFSLVIRSLLTQEGICMTLNPDFKFLEVAYPYVAKRLLTDRDVSLRERLIQVLFKQDKFQWRRLENLIDLARDGGGSLDLTETATDGAGLLLTDAKLRQQLVLALTEDDRLQVDEITRLLAVLQREVNVQKVVQNAVTDGPNIARKFALSWSSKVLAD